MKAALLILGILVVGAVGFLFGYLFTIWVEK